MDQSDSYKFKQQIIRALKISPSNERVTMYEQGRAFDISRKLRDAGSKKVTVIVLERD